MGYVSVDILGAMHADEHGHWFDVEGHKYYFYCDICGSWDIHRLDFQRVVEIGSEAVLLPLFLISLLIGCIFPPAWIISVIGILVYTLVGNFFKERSGRGSLCVCSSCGKTFNPFASSTGSDNRFAYTQKDIPGGKKPNFVDDY